MTITVVSHDHPVTLGKSGEGQSVSACELRQRPKGLASETSTMTLRWLAAKYTHRQSFPVLTGRGDEDTATAGDWRRSEGTFDVRAVVAALVLAEHNRRGSGWMP